MWILQRTEIKDCKTVSGTFWAISETENHKNTFTPILKCVSGILKLRRWLLGICKNRLNLARNVKLPKRENISAGIQSLMAKKFNTHLYETYFMKLKIRIFTKVKFILYNYKPGIFRKTFLKIRKIDMANVTTVTSLLKTLNPHILFQFSKLLTYSKNMLMQTEWNLAEFWF